MTFPQAKSIRHLLPLELTGRDVLRVYSDRFLVLALVAVASTVTFLISVLIRDLPRATLFGLALSLIFVAALIYAGLTIGQDREPKQPAPADLLERSRAIQVERPTLAGVRAIGEKAVDEPHDLAELLLLMPILVLVLAILSTLYVRVLDAVLKVSFWASTSLLLFGGFLLFLGLLRGLKSTDWSTALVAGVAFALSIGLAAATWLLTTPLNPPAGFEQTIADLAMIDVHQSRWIQEAVGIALSHPEVVILLGFQSIALLPLTLGSVLTLYLQAITFLALAKHRQRPMPFLPFIAAFASEFMAVLLLGSSMLFS